MWWYLAKSQMHLPFHSHLQIHSKATLAKYNMTCAQGYSLRHYSHQQKTDRKRISRGCFKTHGTSKQWIITQLFKKQQKKGKQKISTCWFSMICRKHEVEKKVKGQKTTGAGSKAPERSTSRTSNVRITYVFYIFNEKIKSKKEHKNF